MLISLSNIQAVLDSYRFNLILVCLSLYFKRDFIMSLFLHGLGIKWGWTLMHSFIVRTLGISVVEAVQYILYDMESYLGKRNLSGFSQFSNCYSLSPWPISCWKSRLKFHFLFTLPVSMLNPQVYFHSIVPFTLSGLDWISLELDSFFLPVLSIRIRRSIASKIYNRWVTMSWSCKLESRPLNRECST